jgi:hypothetical protein
MCEIEIQVTVGYHMEASNGLSYYGMIHIIERKMITKYLVGYDSTTGSIA